ncbi:E3 ubiquitin-protein ligase Rnf220 OS=Mus musculus GN=Rnf220 PE=1 SV=1 [Rhizoctonia solani AG-1 IB]|uniref:E3 ubiquitin-protein ligase Rnf220 n=1 Tax=Thanatephorus cucumeris (strain AG1-IB / isolate 7/3/14) TaxID=1108050 RepID=A0A0B7G0E6_THACB|nr:E3 ubiquitin-protein ligase Rnf220 OS=Mus musculus GN=Rnf220 PE=1 SV=1 [Rhizoctonia solani AG-1 IB]
MAASRMIQHAHNLRGSKRAGSEFEDEDSVGAGPSSLVHTSSEERPCKKSKQAETRLCPLCNKRIPLHMLAQHTEMELAKVNQVMHADSPDPTARGTGMSYEHNNRRPAAVRARASLTALAPVRRYSNPHPNSQPTHPPPPRRTRHSIAMGPESMVERRQRRVGGVCPVCEDDVPEGLEEHVDRCLQDAVLPHRDREREHVGTPPTQNETGPEEQELVRVTDFTDFRGTGYDIRDRNIPDVDEDLDVDGDEDTVLYGESQFFESDIIAGDEVGSDSRQMSPADTDEQSARLLRELVAARKMVMTQRDVDVEGEEEDERVSIGSSADTSMTWPPAPTGDGKDAQIEALLAQVKQLESALEQAKSQPAVLPKGRSSEGTNDAALTVCRICLDPFMEPVVSTGCWHLFCRECWLRSLGSTKYCPICKRITSTSNLRKVFM